MADSETEIDQSDEEAAIECLQHGLRHGARALSDNTVGAEAGDDAGGSKSEADELDEEATIMFLQHGLRHRAHALVDNNTLGAEAGDGAGDAEKEGSLEADLSSGQVGAEPTGAVAVSSLGEGSAESGDKDEEEGSLESWMSDSDVEEEGPEVKAPKAIDLTIDDSGDEVKVGAAQPQPKPQLARRGPPRQGLILPLPKAIQGPALADLEQRRMGT